VVNGLRWLVCVGVPWRMMPNDLPPRETIDQHTAESGPRARDDGAKRQRGSKVPMAVDPLGHLLALHVTVPHEQDRAQVAQWAEQVQAVTGDAVEGACVDQGYTGDRPAQAAAAPGLPREVVKRPEAKQGFGLLPRRGVVARRVAWMARFRRLARGDERLPAPLAGLPFLAFVILLLKRVVEMMSQGASHALRKFPRLWQPRVRLF